MSCDSRKHLKEERDAAIERGKRLWFLVELYLGELCEFVDRAEAAERDAEAKGALSIDAALEWCRKQPGASWIATIKDLEKIRAALTPAEKEAPDPRDPRDPPDPNP